MLEALALKGSSRIDERHKEALRDLEEFFGVKGLLAGDATVTYKQANAKMQAAMQRVPSPTAHSQGVAANQSPQQTVYPTVQVWLILLAPCRSAL